MEYAVLHTIPGRMRVKLHDIPINEENAQAIGKLLSMQEGVLSAEISLRTGNLLIHYADPIPKSHLEALLDVLEPADWEDVTFDLIEHVPSFFDRSFSAIIKTVATTLLRWLILPPIVRYCLIILEALPIITTGIASLRRGKLDINVLDAVSLSILAIRRDFGTMRTIMWMIKVADTFNHWTRGHSRITLSESLELNIEAVWLKKGVTECQCAMSEVKKGDLLVVRTGWIIPVDGTVVEGEALVNQSVLTGESLAVHKDVGLSVFAGSVIDEGEIVIRVESTAGETRLQNIISFIEGSEAVKGDIQCRAEQMANRLVFFNFVLSFTILIMTRNPLKASAALMVDYSCATRLATPLTILSTIMEGIRHGVLIKGGKYIEATALANSLVIDKTGTLTRSKSSVSKVMAFNGWNKKEVLRIAASIEEHFHHPIGRAVVKKAEAENLQYKKRHSKIKYVPAHGITAMLDGKQIVIGSAHFIFEDMGIPMTSQVEQATEIKASKGRSLLYMAHDGQIVGMMAIEDPIRPDAKATISALLQQGIDQITMLTGDGKRTAKAVADQLGITYYHSGLMPVDKAKLIQKMQHNGEKVMFVGDGINDSPALSAADVGITLQDGSDVAKEVAGIVLLNGKLANLVTARHLSSLALQKIDRQFTFVVAFNSALLALGLLGCISLHLTALLHNSGTVAVTLNSLRRLLPENHPDLPIPQLDTDQAICFEPVTKEGEPS